MTVGATDSAPDAITSLWKDGYLERLDLLPLSLREVTALLETALGGEVERSSAEHLWGLAGGTVLFCGCSLPPNVRRAGCDSSPVRGDGPVT